jgi:hypothetical protein
VTPSTVLNPGSGRFWVRASNSFGSGPWSSYLAFTVPGGGGGAGARVVLTGPTGTVLTNTPTYTWNAATGASSYVLYIDDSSGGTVQVQVTAADAGCDADSTCAFTPPVPLDDGPVTYWARGVGGSWSAGRTFTVDTGP